MAPTFTKSQIPPKKRAKKNRARADHNSGDYGPGERVATKLGKPPKASRNGNAQNSKMSNFEQAFRNIDDVLRKEAGCTTELDYTEQTSWLLFLKYLDALELDKAMEAELQRKKYDFILDKPYRWEE